MNQKFKTIALAALTLTTLSAAVIAQDSRTPVYVAGNKPIAPYSPGIKLSNGMLFVSGQIPMLKEQFPMRQRMTSKPRPKLSWRICAVF